MRTIGQTTHRATQPGDGCGWWGQVRGMGLIVGVQMTKPAGTVVGACRAKGLLVLTAGAGDVMRILPPLVVTEEEIQQAVAIIVDCIKADADASP